MSKYSDTEIFLLVTFKNIFGSKDLIPTEETLPPNNASKMEQDSGDMSAIFI